MGEPVAIHAWVDFLCPWSYVVATRLERLGEQGTLAVIWRAWLTIPERQERELAGFRRETAEWLEPASAEPSLTFSLWSTDNPPPSHSPPAQAAALLASRLFPGQASAYRRALFRAHFAQNRTISDSATLIAIAREVGVDDDAFAMGLRGQYPDLLHTVLRDHKQANENAIDRSPALLVGNRFLAKGPVSEEQIRTLVGKVDPDALPDPAAADEQPTPGSE